MSEPGEEDLLETPRSERADRAEAIATLVALVWVGTSAVVLSVFGGNISLIGIMAIGPFIACAFARPLRVALVGALGTFFALVISTPPHSYGTVNHLLRVFTQILATALAMWISYLRGKRTVQLWTARSETRNERRRRVAAETAERMQAMARALTTAADPAQVADAVFAALRDELHVDAATFALVSDAGQLQTLRRFGYDPEEPIDAVLPALRPDGPVLGQNMAFFAESLEDLRHQRADVFATLASNRFSALAVVPMVVSDHAIGAVVVHWEYDREIADPDRSFLLTITGAAAQAVERARLTVTEFVNLERSQHLHRLSSALAAASTPGDVAHAAISGARRALGAHSGVMRIPDLSAHALFCLASSGHPSLLSAGMLPLDGGHSGACFTHGGTVVATLGSGDDVGPDLAPELAPGVLAQLERPVTIVTEALIGSAGTLGVLSLAFVGQPEPAEPDRRFLSTLAGLTAQALERAQLFEHEREALRTAEAARERLSLLSEVTRLLSSSLEPTTVIRRTMTLVEGRLADVCVVQVPGDNGLVRLDVRGPRGPHGDAEHGDGGTEEVRYDSDTPAAVAFRTGRTQLAVIDDDGRPLADLHEARAAGVAGAALPPGAFTALAVPLSANGEVIGVMTFIDGPGRAFEEDDVSLATEVASRAGVALSNATRFQREHVVAEVLQRSVLPEFLPDVSGLRLDAEYRAGIAGTYAGGDWYDVFPVGDDTYVFSVGDVMGKGAPAAALMGQVRSAIRAYAVSGQSPAEVLTSLDRLFDALAEDRVLTAIVGRITASTGRIEMCNAGHPPPLHVRADGTVSYCPAQGSLLIAAGLGGLQRKQERLVLERGDALVMYSDGLIERRGELITDGMDRLASAARAVVESGWPDRPAVTFASMLSEEERTDDVVVLCLHRDTDDVVATGDGISPAQVGRARVGMAVLELEPVVESTPLARHWVSAQLGNVPAEVASCAALLTSELVTNAVLHAATPICVTLHVMPDRIRIDVADRSSAVPSVKDYGRDAATGRGLTLFDTLASAWGVQMTDGGKIVWFELPVDFPVPPVGVSDGSFRFDLAGITQLDGRAEPDAGPMVTVRLRGIPVALLQKSSEEYEALFRELRLMKERSDVAPAAPALPERLEVLISRLGTRFNGLGPGMDEVWQQALDEHLDAFDWTLELPQSAAAACQFYDTMLDEADEFAQSARLLTLPASPTSVAVRRWFLSELFRQLNGEAPVPWADSPQHADLTLRSG